ncbi:hypothetical protein CHUAL_008998 [Chamberlinius hualienensis]
MESNSRILKWTIIQVLLITNTKKTLSESLKLLEAPKNVTGQLGHSVTLECQFNKQVKCYWKRNLEFLNFPLDNYFYVNGNKFGNETDNCSLKISNLSEKDLTHWRCGAFDELIEADAYVIEHSYSTKGPKSDQMLSTEAYKTTEAPKTRIVLKNNVPKNENRTLVPPQQKSNNGMIIGIIVGSVFISTFIIIGFVYIVFKKTKRTLTSTKDLLTAESIVLEHVINGSTTKNIYTQTVSKPEDLKIDNIEHLRCEKSISTENSNSIGSVEHYEDVITVEPNINNRHTYTYIE